MSVSIYKLSEVKFLAFGVPVEDMPEDGEIRIEYDRPRVTKLKDINRGGLYGWREGKPATVSIQVLPGSDWVARFQNYRNLGKTLPIAIVDNNDYAGKAKFICSKAMIQDGGVGYTSDPTPVDFVFECMQLDDAYLDVEVPTL